MLRLLLPLALVAAPAALADEADPVRKEAAEARGAEFAMAIDADGDGILSDRETAAFADAVFAAVDADGDGLVDLDEVLAAPTDLAAFAAFRGRSDALRDELTAFLVTLDVDGDRALTEAEHRAGLLGAGRDADADGDGTLTRGEFVEGHAFAALVARVLDDG